MAVLFRELADLDLDLAPAPGPAGTPGKRTMTAGLTPRASVVFEVGSPEAAEALGAALPWRAPTAAAAGPAPASIARKPVDRAAAPLDDPFALHLLPQPASPLQVSSPGDALEHEADRAADAMVSGRPAAVSGGGRGTQLAREVEPQVTGEMIEWTPVQEDVEWNQQYADRYKKTRPTGDSAQSDFDAERASGKVKSASSQGGIKVKTQLSDDQVRRIIAAGGEKEAAERCAGMAGALSGAFETMMIDTAQAQADYLAHMAGETGGVLEEKQGEKRDYAPFQGRGPVQVTHPENYAKALGTLQQRADQINKQIDEISRGIADLMSQRDKATDPEEKKKIVAKIDAAHKQVDTLRTQLVQLFDAINAIKQDPKAAADPKYAFLLSAALMHKTGAVAATGRLGADAAFDGNGAADSWVTGGNKGMTFDQRRVENEGELAEINKKLETETDEGERKKLTAGAAARTRLIADMKSAKSRGQKKAKVYSAAVRILTAENATSP